MNDSRPVVSVILPNYNHAGFLRERLDSILNQSYRDFELIILDDCSTDISMDIINEYLPSDKVSHVVVNDKNSGSTFLQWKKGFALAKGKYIWIAESDDYAELTFLEKLVPLLENNQDCNIAFCCSHSVDENGNILQEDWDRNKEPQYAVNKFDGSSFIKARMLFNNSIYNASMVLFRADILKNIDDRFMDFKYCGDWLFWNEICLLGGVIRYCDKLNYFRQHPHKVTPRAESEGIRFTEGKYVMDYIMQKLNLDSIQRTVIIGRFLKRIIGSTKYKNKQVRKNVLTDIKKYFKCTIIIPVFAYEFDKVFNFSHLNIKKSRHL